MSSVISQWSKSVVPPHSHRTRSAELQQGRYPARPEQGWSRLAPLLPGLHARLGSHHLRYPQKHLGEPSASAEPKLPQRGVKMNPNCFGGKKGIPAPVYWKPKTCLREQYTGDDSRKKKNIAENTKIMWTMCRHVQTQTQTHIHFKATSRRMHAYIQKTERPDKKQTQRHSQHALLSLCEAVLLV